MKRQLWVALGWLVFIAQAQAASFDCTKATTKVEKLVCKTPVVSMLDDYLRHMFLEVMNKANEEQKQRLMTEQKNWLKNIRNLCTDKSCLKEAYLTRIDELQIISEKMPVTVVTETYKTESHEQTAKKAPTRISSLDEIKNLLSMAYAQLKERQKGAHDVLFYNSTKGETAYCKRLWDSIQNQDVVDIPKPDMLATSKKEKEKMFETLYGYAKNNFDRYMSQDGRLTPDQYTDATGRTWRLSPFIKGKLNDPKDLPKKFGDAWQNNSDGHLFFGKYPLLDQDSSTNILYMQPYPVAGYVHPLVITFLKDQCDKCTGFSMGIRIVSVDGLTQPDLYSGEYFSQASHADAVAKANRLDTVQPGDPSLLMGMSQFGDQLVFWRLERQEWTNPSAREIDEDMGYENGDGFRDYWLLITPLDEHGYGVPSSGCIVKFN